MSDNNTSRVLKFQKSISYREILLAIVNKWYIIAGAVVLMFILTFIYTTVFVTPMYTSVAKIMIFNKQQITTTNDLELSSSLSLTRDFKEIITDKTILSDVSDRLNGKYTAAELKGFISIDNPLNTRIIVITALTPDAKDSKRVVDAVCDVSQEKLVEIMGLDRITVISNGDVAKAQTTPRMSNNLLIGILCGLVIGCLFIFVMYMLDNKISSAEDVESNFGISVLATIPHNSRQKAKK